MKLKLKIQILSLAFLACLLSCQKNDLFSNLESESQKIFGVGQQSFEKQDLVNWVDAHKINSTVEETSILKSLAQNLDYDNLILEKRNNGDNIIIIPLVSEKGLKLDDNSINNLMIIQSSTGKFKWSKIVSFLPSSDNAQNRLASGTLQSILNNAPVNQSGLFKFLDLKGRLSYQIEYKNGKIASFGQIMKKTNLPKNLKSSSKANSTISSSSEHCTDYYLVTTIYYSDGTSETTSEYMFTLCDNGEPGDDSGGGGGEGTGPEEDNDQAITINGSFEETETVYDNDDYAEGDSGGISPYDQIDPPTDAGLITGSPSLVRYRFNYTHIYIPGVSEGFRMGNVQVFPNNETYFNSAKGWTTRVITPITLYSGFISNGDYTATLRWDYTINWRYTYLNIAVYPSVTRQTSGTKTKLVTTHYP